MITDAPSVAVGPGGAGPWQAGNPGGDRGGRTMPGTAERPAPGTSARPEPGAAPRAGRGAGPEPAHAVEAADALTGPVACTEHAVIGDQLRIPGVWCDLAPCISRHTDRAALGEADVRARALAAGWRLDALGRMVCPACQQTDTRFWGTRQVIRWERDAAITMAALMVAGFHDGGRGAGGFADQTEVIPAFSAAVTGPGLGPGPSIRQPRQRRR